MYRIVCIDTSGSMASTDVTPENERFKVNHQQRKNLSLWIFYSQAKHNNRFGAVLDSFYVFATARENFRDKLTVISFDEDARYVERNALLSSKTIETLAAVMNPVGEDTKFVKVVALQP